MAGFCWWCVNLNRLTTDACTLQIDHVLLFQLLHGEGEVGVGERLVAEREVPPFGIECAETVVKHRPTQDHAVGKLLGGDAPSCGALAVVASVFASLGVAAEVGMTLRTEPVECATHIQFLFRCHIKQSQVYGRTTGVSTFAMIYSWSKSTLLSRSG